MPQTGPGDAHDRAAMAQERAEAACRRSGRLRLRGAEMSERLARSAETFADYLEKAAGRSDRDRRLRIAAVEREIAAIERRNAARLRQADDRSPLESLPRLPGAGAAADDAPDSR